MRHSSTALKRCVQVGTSNTLIAKRRFFATLDVRIRSSILCQSASNPIYGPYIGRTSDGRTHQGVRGPRNNCNCLRVLKRRSRKVSVTIRRLGGQRSISSVQQYPIVVRSREPLRVRFDRYVVVSGEKIFCDSVRTQYPKGW
eukprot:2370917-Pyramimonas_sp.AAC.1